MASHRGVVMNRGAILAHGRQLKKKYTDVLLLNNYHYNFYYFPIIKCFVYSLPKWPNSEEKQKF